MATRNVILVILILGATLWPDPAGADPAARHRPRSRRLGLDVKPTPEIDAQVSAEVARARRIIENLKVDSLLDSPYLVSAVYYHDGFLNDYPDRGDADPDRRIIGQISNLLSEERKRQFIRLLHELWARSNAPFPERSAEPVAYQSAGGGRRSHRYAIDLFAPEGAAVHAVSRGIIVLADRGWDPQNLFSTSSRRGGNAVIVFDPDHDRFYRYCHLSAVEVSAGAIVAAGQAIGAVGHTGLDASQPGHGRHLHFEANEYVDGHMRAIDQRRLRTLLRAWRPRS